MAVFRAIPDVLVAAAWWAVASLALWIEIPEVFGPYVGHAAAMALVYLIAAAIAVGLLFLVRAVHNQPALRDQVIAAAELSRLRHDAEGQQDMAA